MCRVRVRTRDANSRCCVDETDADDVLDQVAQVKCPHLADYEAAGEAYGAEDHQAGESPAVVITERARVLRCVDMPMSRGRDATYTHCQKCQQPDAAKATAKNTGAALLGA